MDYFQMVEGAWTLSDAARTYVAAAGRDVSLDEIWEAVFSPSPLVDGLRSRKEGWPASERIFLKSPYGLRYRADIKDWIPFRHAPVDLLQVSVITNATK